MMRWSALYVIIFTLPGVVRGQASDSVTKRVADRGFVGSARVNIYATYARDNDLSSFVFAGEYAPFVSEHWQVGVQPAGQVASYPGGHSQAEGASVLANYLFGGGYSSRPYVGAFASATNQSGGNGTAGIGFQGGWLHFLSPTVALRGEFRYRHYSTMRRAADFEDVFVTMDPYLFGRANERLTSVPSFGVFDASFAAEWAMKPSRLFTLQGAIAPFVVRWFQPGVSADFVTNFKGNGSAHNFEAFGRGYLPLETRFVPFADVFAGTANNNGGQPSANTHGARAGVRAYLTRGVALDVAYEWRKQNEYDLFDAHVSPPEVRTLRVTMMTQFRVRRAAHSQ